MKTKVLIFLIPVLFLISGSVFLNRNILENDEGIYWATLLLTDKGYRLYSDIAFSQLPGFVLSIYSIFKLFGSSILAARLAVFYWSGLALLSLIWLGHIKKNFSFSLVLVFLLISLPSFFNQAITLQSDMVAVAFSTLSFVFMIVFLDYSAVNKANNNSHYLWLGLSSIFFSLALLTKLDYSLLVPFAFILFTFKKNRIRSILLFCMVGILTFLMTLNYFGFSNVIKSVLVLREKALSVYPFEPLKFFTYLRNDLLLSGILLINIFYLFINRNKDKIFLIHFFWFASSIILILTFRPLFQHHLVFLTVPAVLFFAESLKDKFTSINQLIGVRTIICLIIILTFFVLNLFELNKRENSTSIKEREIARNYILNNSNRNDVIITDEAALYGMTGRLPPPELVDLSYVQIQSKNITPEKFNAAVTKYQPKLIITWNGRLNELENLDNLAINYRQIYSFGNKKIYLLEK